MKKHILTCILISTLFFFTVNTANELWAENRVDSEENELVAMFISDFHIGENYGAVVQEIPAGSDDDYIGHYVEELGTEIYYHTEVANLLEELEKRATIPYLIILGDVFDVAVDEVSDAFNLSQIFFNSEINGSTFMSHFDNVIFVAGNHDHHVWIMLQERYYIQNQLTEGKEANPFPQQVVGTLELGEEQPSLWLDENVINNDPTDNFMSSILSNNSKPVYVIYPNLYIKYNDGNGICATHGHFFEKYWNKDTTLIEHFPKIPEDEDYFKNLQKYNAPFTEFANYAIAQVSDVFAQGLADAPFEENPPEKFQRIGLYLAENYSEFFPLASSSVPLSNIQKLENEADKVATYLKQARKQMSEYGLSFDVLVYGHTHKPCYNQSTEIDPDITIHNTGGWVNINVKDTDDFNNSTLKKPNPMFLYTDGTIEKILDR
jgi:predicted phosphodiesterase